MKKRKEDKQCLIYCGPSFPDGTLAKHTVFRGCVPAHVEKMIERNPAIKGLLVPVEKLAGTVKKIAEPTSAERNFYQKIVESFKKQGA